jgi:hypothetical protein
MDDSQRFRLLGTYKTPRFRIGQKVFCEIRGDMTITGITDAPIPWPVGKGRRGRHSLIVYKGLEKALRCESNQAIAYWWGIDPQTVSKWRRLLGVERATPGTSRLHSEYNREPWAIEARAKAQSKARDPERCRKIAEARRGKPRRPHVVEAVRQAHLGTRHSEETRQRMSEAHKKRGTLVPGTALWVPEEDERVRALPIAEVMRRAGRPLDAAQTRLHGPGSRGTVVVNGCGADLVQRLGCSLPKISVSTK